MRHSSVPVLIHASQFPGVLKAELADSLRSRTVNHKFHYDSVKQTAKWLEIHRAFSPAVTDPDCGALYEAASAQAALMVAESRTEVIGLGCGGGWKDALLLRALETRSLSSTYWAVDSSVPMTLVARENTTPDARLLVCDLASPLGVPEELLARPGSGVRRVVTFYGLIPNFESDQILPILSPLLAEGDMLLLSANLAPGDDYFAGVASVLPLYDNPPTRDWLMIFLLDLGFEKTDGDLMFSIHHPGFRKPPPRLLRIQATFILRRERTIEVEGESFRFATGETIRLFFSYRHTPALLRELLSGHGIQVEAEWLNSTGEEGVFLARKAPRLSATASH
jgi:L-histidine N-alpha-methyltransferase